MEEDLLGVQAHLTDRDHLLLGWLADHGVLTTFQIAHALYPSRDFAQRRLKRLWQDKHLLGRFRPFRAEGGTYPYHWLLSQLGTDVVATQRCETCRAGTRPASGAGI
jgi:protein involved in plasmid replication-relaxation